MAKNYLDKEGLAYLWNKIKNYIKDKDIRTATPVGGSIDWYGPESTIPSDWMREDGRSLSKTQYPELFAIIGYTYGGSGDNFNIPNSKGRVNVHLNESDTEFNTLAKLYGSKTHTLTVAQLPAHEHGFEGYIYKDPEGGYDKVLIYGRPQGSAYTNWGTKSTGDNQPHNNIQPSIVSYKIIKVKEDAASRDLRLLDDKITEMEPTNWVKVTYTEGFGDGTYGGLRYRREGKHVFLQGTVRGAYTNTGFNQGITIASLPNTFRPKTAIYKLNNAAGSRQARVGVTTSGNIFLDYVVNIQTGKIDNNELAWIDCTIDYWVD